jgi:outer membrane protein W
MVRREAGTPAWRKENNMTTRRLWLFVMVVALVVSAPALAEKGDSKIRFGAQLVSPTGDYTETEEGETFTIEADSATGLFVEYEYMVGDKAGIFANLSQQSHDITASAFGIEADFGETDLMPLEVGVNFYAAETDTLQFYLGPKLVYAMWDDVDVVGGGTIKLKDTFGFGANFGLDFPIGDNGWAITTGLQYIVLDAETDEGVDDVDIGIDPFVLKVGAAKTW